MVGEAAAAGYLSDVEGGLNPSAALQAASAMRPGGRGGAGSTAASSTSSGGSVEEGSAAASRAEAAAAAVLGLCRGSTELDALIATDGLLGSALAAGSSRSGGGSVAASGLLPLEASYWPTFTHHQLSSTRQLQRFTNQASWALQ